jgi:hypothetical protein
MKKQPSNERAVVRVAAQVPVTQLTSVKGGQKQGVIEGDSTI